VHDHGVSDRRANQRRLSLALVLAASYMLAEAAGGLWTGSLALLADAGHMLSDVAALSLSVLALRIAQRPGSAQQTYGHHRTEILAALTNGALLVGVALTVLVEAIERLGTPRDILGGPMLAIACGGLAVNLAALWSLHAGRHHDLNVRGAWLHVASDALGSVGAIVAGALVWVYGWSWADPLASIAIALLVLRSAWSLLREAVAVLMEWAPAHLDVAEIERTISALPGVAAVHDLHVWTITSGMIALSGHVVAHDDQEHGKLLQDVSNLLHERFSVSHSTIQVESDDFDEPGGVCFTREESP
jgi:cobalt-zinc-cadmium efflux system protein